MDDTDIEAGTRLDDTVGMDLSWLARPRRLAPEILAADAATYARIQEACTVVALDAFIMHSAFGPDIPIQYRLTMAGGTTLDADDIPFFPSGGQRPDERPQGE
jgi:hypothetical protein